MPENSGNIQQLDVQAFDFLTFYKSVKQKNGKQYILLDQNPKALFKKIRSKCKLIKAAGGLVRNSEDNYLFIFRNKKWDLPKGKVEKGEKMREAAVREVEEECGVKILTNDTKLCKTYHVYPLEKQLVLKKTNWYSMTVAGCPELVPQIEEGISNAEWLSGDDLKPIINNTYPSILDVLEAGGLL